MNFLHLTTDQYNNLKELLDGNKYIFVKIIQAKYIQTMEIWEVTFDNDLTAMDGFYLGQHI